MTNYPIHLQEKERLKREATKLKLNPLIQVINGFNFKSIRHENVGEGYLLSLLKADDKSGFDFNDELLKTARILNPGSDIYNDDVIDPRNVNSYAYVDCIVTENLLNNLNAVDTKSLIFSQSTNADYCIHYVKILPEAFSAKRPFYGLDYYLSFKPSYYSLFNNSEDLLLILKNT